MSIYREISDLRASYGLKARQMPLMAAIIRAADVKKRGDMA